MSLKFTLSGPVFEYDQETKITFKRVSSKQVFQWELENSILTGRTPEEMKEFAKRAGAGESNWDHYSNKEKSDLSSLSSRFCIDFAEKIEGIKDPDSGKEIDYQSFDQETKIRFWDQLSDENSFIDWLSKYKAGGEKKSGPVDEND